MNLNLLSKIVCYHYTNPESYLSMKTGEIYGEKGLIPIKRFMRLDRGSRNFPKNGYNGIVEGLLEPEPVNLIYNRNFPRCFGYLMHDICRRSHVMLLSFEILQTDDAFIVERAHFEKELYREASGRGKSNHNTMARAARKYYESRVKAFEYDGSYELPQFAIWSKVEFERLNIEWIKPTSEVWKRVLDNKWY